MRLLVPKEMREKNEVWSTMQLTILGTSAMVPTKTRNQTAIFLKHDDQGLLFDCGEGTQRQFQLAGIPLTRITSIFITHWHGDHTQGLPGIIQSLGANEYKKTLHIFGPPGTTKRLQALHQAFVFELKIEMQIHEVKEGLIVDAEKYTVEAVKLNHSVATFGYKVKENDRRKINTTMLKKHNIPSGPHLKPLSQGKNGKYKDIILKAKDFTNNVKGKTISFIWDTGLDKQVEKLAKGSDVIVSEATFCNDMEKKAKDFRHLTAAQIAKVAKKVKAKKLILMHFSPRYKNIKEIKKEAQELFKETIAPKDLETIEI